MPSEARDTREASSDSTLGEKSPEFTTSENKEKRTKTNQKDVEGERDAHTKKNAAMRHRSKSSKRKVLVMIRRTRYVEKQEKEYHKRELTKQKKLL